MEITISNEIEIKNPTPSIINFCKKELAVANPEFYNKLRRGFWIGDTPDKLFLYRVDGPRYYLPFGTWDKIRELIPEGVHIDIDVASNPKVNYGSKLPLYDYQEGAVKILKTKNNGILQAPCGSGKTQMGIALAIELGRKTLWLTHTRDLLKQSKDRAAQYIDKSLIGTITGGKINISEGITFATVQTLSKSTIDLSQYKYTWDVVIVDECHRVAGTPTTLTMFSKVINSLAAPRKYGLSATVDRRDGLIITTFSLLGKVAHLITDEAVSDKTMDVTVQEIKTGIKMSDQYLNTDGTLNYHALIDYLTGNVQRNKIIASKIAENKDHSNIIMSDRLQHLKEMIECLKAEGIPEDQIRMIDGSMTSKKAKAYRQQAIEDMITRKARFLFLSYNLGKEGLNIPVLDRLYFTIPKEDFIAVTQSVGRIQRKAEGKDSAICYDFVDDIGYCKKTWKNRKTSYRKKRCKIIEDLKPPAINNNTLLAFIEN